MTACLDPVYRGNAIYEHVAENRGRSYVEEQIRHARIQLQKDADAEITTINTTHALVLAGDKAVVMKLEKINGQNQFRLVQVDAFRKWFANRFVTVSDKPKGTPAVAKEGVTSFPGAGGQGLRNERAGADQRMAK
jgi:hypothetical protein